MYNKQDNLIMTHLNNLNQVSQLGIFVSLE
jgi:hypothetical protein